MVAKKKVKKSKRRTSARPARWEKDAMAPGTITVQISLVHVFRMMENIGKSLHKPEYLLAARDMLNQLIEQLLNSKKPVAKKKGRGKPDSSLN